MGSKVKTDSVETVEGEWSYLRANLDNPRHLLASRLGHGLAEWILGRWQRPGAEPAPMAMIARLPLGPRQSLALVEAEGTRVLVGVSADGAPTFFPLPPYLSFGPSALPAVHDGGPGSSGPADARAERHAVTGGPGRASRRGPRLGLPGRVSW